MKGNVISIKKKGYGFILGEDGEDYFFHCSQLNNCTMDSLTEGDLLNFDISINNGKKKAKSIERIINSQKKIHNKAINSNTKQSITTPGINPQFLDSHFSNEEKDIIKILAKTFYVTNGGSQLYLGATSTYRYCLVKPTTYFGEQFNLTREIIVVFSDYDSFEPRSLDAISEVHRKNEQKFRIDKICSIIVSKDSSVVKKIYDLLKHDLEMQVIIPFTYSELSIGNQSELITKRFRTHFYDRDLFAFESPLKKDIYFFGRREYIHQLINRHNSAENSGVFGLRRSGKTSILQAIERALKITNSMCIFLDCQDLYHYSWNRALFSIIEKIYSCAGLKLESNQEIYTEEDANNLFQKDLQFTITNTTNDILLLFDEIEQITPNISLNKNWRGGDDFIKLWQTLRSNFHKQGSKFTFIIAGTNPSAIETMSFNGHPNPLYNQLKSDSYINPFNVENTKEMVNKLGGYMGLSFDDIVCANLTQDFGGHPYLIRHYCSAVNKYINEHKLSKPLTISSPIYNKVMPSFVRNSADNYCKFILTVLIDYYPQENKFLEQLALGNLTLEDISRYDPVLISHLIGYGIIKSNGNLLDFSIDVLRNYLTRKYRYKKVYLTTEEKWAEISERRNRIEPKLRIIVKNQLKASLGNQAKQAMLESMKPDLKIKYSSLSYDDLFKPEKCEIYFSQLGLVIERKWNKCFSNLFSKSKQVIKSYFTIINNLRSDCHATEIKDNEMDSFRGAMTSLEKEVDNYFSS